MALTGPVTVINRKLDRLRSKHLNLHYIPNEHYPTPVDITCYYP